MGFTLKNDAGIRFKAAECNGLINNRFVGKHFIGFLCHKKQQSQRLLAQHLQMHRQFVGCETSKHNRVNRP